MGVMQDKSDLKPLVLPINDNDDSSSDDGVILLSHEEDKIIPVKKSMQSVAATDKDDDLPTFSERRRYSTCKYESLDYDVCENKLWKNDKKTNSKQFAVRKDFARWSTYVLIGILTALIACIIDIVIEEISAFKYGFLKESVDYHILYGDLYVPYLLWVASSILPVAIGSSLVTYIEPVAAGSGLPQIKCYLNGVKVPRIVRLRTLAVKAIGVITSVVGGLAGGKEGPMIHSGAVVAAGISQGKSTSLGRDFQVFKYFRDDHEKRDFVLGGAAAGVSAAFGAPIGGVLFSLEEAASFWNQILIWRVLVASTISSFTLNVVLSAYHGLKDFTIPGLFNLGKFEKLPYEYFELPIYLTMAIIGGLLGAAWNSMNTRLNLKRKRFVKQKWAQVLEAILVAMTGATLACFMIYWINDCRPLGNDPTSYPVQMFCEDNEYNAAASLWFQTPEASVKSLFHDPPGSHTVLTLSVFVIIYFYLSCITFGLNVSMGIFIPTVLVGAAWGRLFGMLLNYIFPAAEFLNPGKYALIGAAAHLGGVLRMTISLSVILIETTGIDTSFAFPLIITLMTAKWMGDYFNEGIYDIQIRIGNVPMLHPHLDEIHENYAASQLMSAPAKCIKLRAKVSYVYELLKKCNHNGFPVIDNAEEENRSNGRLCGIILRSQLIVIIKNKLFEENRQFWEQETTIEIFRNAYPRYSLIEDVRYDTDKGDYTINCELFMNPSPVNVSKDDSAPRIYQMFRALGLRHIVVVDKNNCVEGVITRKDFIGKSR